MAAEISIKKTSNIKCLVLLLTSSGCKLQCLFRKHFGRQTDRRTYQHCILWAILLVQMCL